MKYYVKNAAMTHPLEKPHTSLKAAKAHLNSLPFPEVAEVVDETGEVRVPHTSCNLERVDLSL